MSNQKIDRRPTDTVLSMGRIHFSGNIIPHTWYQHLVKEKKHRSGDGEVTAQEYPYLEAIVILSDICYWYRPSVVRDEVTGKVIRQDRRFAADKLQRSYDQYGELLGLSKEKSRNALKWLAVRGIITLEFRSIDTGSGRLSNVLFIEPVPAMIELLNLPTPPCQLTHTPLSVDPHLPGQLTDTYTESSSKTTTEKKPPAVSPISTPRETEASLKSKALVEGLTNEDFKDWIQRNKEGRTQRDPISVLDGREPNWADPVQAGGADELAELLIEGVCQFNVAGCGLETLPDKQRKAWLRRASEIIQEWGGGNADQVGLAWRSWTLHYEWRSTVNPFAKNFSSEFGQYLVGVREGKITERALDLKERGQMKPLDGDAVLAEHTPAPLGGIRVNVGTFDNPVWKDLGDV